MVAILVLPILVLLIAGFLALIVFAIVRKKWVLLFIPLGLVAVLAVVAFVGYFYAMPTAAQYKDSYPYSTVEHPANNTSNVRKYVVEESRSNSSGKNVRKLYVSSKKGGNVVVGNDGSINVSSGNGNSVVVGNGNVKVTRSQPNVVHTSVTPNFAFSSLILLMAFVALVVLVIIAAIRKKWALLFIPLGFAGLAVVSVFLLRFVHMPTSSSNDYTQIATPDRNASPDQNYSIVADKPLPAVWSPGIEKDYQADTYYSKIAALRSIANRLDKIVAQMVLNGKPIPAELALITYKEKCPKELLAEAYNIIQETLPDTNCIIVPTVTAEMDSEWLVGGKWYKKENWISFDFTEFPNPSGNYHITGQPFNNEDLLRGSIKASIHLDGRSVPVSTSIVSKPWLENFSAFQNSTPQRQFTVAYSQTSCRSLDQAARQASSQAQQIVGQLITDIQRSMPRARRGMGNYTLSREDLYKSGIIVDNFHQSFNVTVSPIYRQALLLDVSPEKIHPLAQQKINSYNVARQSWAYHIMSAIGIALVICVIYLILNAATKGYYTVVLRILTVIGIIAVVLLLTV